MSEWNEKTLARVNAVIDGMVERHEKINFYSVAEQTGYSRMTLYKNPVIKERIMSLRETSEKMLKRAEERDWAGEARKRWNKVDRSPNPKGGTGVYLIPEQWEAVRAWYDYLKVKGLVSDLDEAAYAGIVSQTKRR